MPLQKVLIVSNMDLNILLFRRSLIKALLQRNLEVHICVPRGQHGMELMQRGAYLWHYPLVRGSLNPLAVPEPYKVMRDLIKHIEPDVIHTFTHQPNILVRLATNGKAKVVHTITGLGSGFLQPGIRGISMRTFFKLLYFSTAHRCDALVFQNEDDRNYFKSYGLIRGRKSLCIRGSGVDTERFHPDAVTREEVLEFRRSVGVEPDQILVTMTARLLYDKGIMDFSRAANELADAFPNTRFMIVGEADPGNARCLSDEHLEMLRQQKNLILAGWRDDMPLVWCASDMAVLPSYREGLPMSLQEGMSCGLPVIATDVPGCREIVDEGVNGLLVPFGDKPAIAVALRELIVNPERRKKMGQASRDKAVEEFDGRKIAQQHLELYEELLED